MKQFLLGLPLTTTIGSNGRGCVVTREREKIFHNGRDIPPVKGEGIQSQEWHALISRRGVQ